ncbi:MAG: hypothetical protein ACUVQI_00650 [Thermochromatium sp.]
MSRSLSGLYTDTHGLRRKDCSGCRLPHEGYQAYWSFIQKWLERPRIWGERALDARERKAAHGG